MNSTRQIGGLSLERVRRLLCSLQDHIQSELIRARASRRLAEVAAVTAADTIYRIDRISESAITGWLSEHWPKSCALELVMEGLEEESATYPRGTPVGDTAAKCIIDPIDGTRCLMYDKRPAWILTGVAPQRGLRTNLRDIAVAAMTELPTTKQAVAEQWSAVRGRGRRGIVGQAVDLRTRRRTKISPAPSSATDCRHGFASFVKFFPDGKELTARIEEALWKELAPAESNGSPVVFDDQYLTTGGQLREILVGHDRMIADIRPLVFRRLRLGSSLVCHPYDICTALVLTEAGGIVEKPQGGPLDAPLDTTSPVGWVGYANATVARTIRPVLRRLLAEHCAS